MKSKRTITLAAAILIATALSLTSCGGAEEQAADDPRNVNLIPLHRHARHTVETGEVDLDSVRTSYYFLGGSWSAPYPDENFGGTVIAAVKRDSRMRFSIIKPADRWLVFRAAARSIFGGPATQQVNVLVNDQEAGSFNLDGDDIVERQVFIPAALQHPGDNIVVFQFADFDTNAQYTKSRNERRKFPYRGIAAYFADLRVVFGDQNGPVEGHFRRYDDVLQPAAEDRWLRQRPTSMVSYAFDTGEGSVLGFEGTIEAPAGESSVITASIQMRTDAEREWHELWSKTLTLDGSGSESFADELTFENVGDSAVEVRLVADSSVPFSQASVIWKKLTLRLPEPVVAEEKQKRAPIRITDRLRNVVIIVNDAFRADLLGTIGDGSHTPNMTALSKESIVFNQAIAAAPYTVASVSSLFSGLIPDAHGVRRGRDTFPEHLDTMAKAFVRKDYYTLVMAGLPFIKRKFGITRDCEKEVYLRSEENREAGISTMELDTIKQSIAEAKASGKPVFIYTHLLPPHWPYSPPPPFGDLTNHDGKKEDRLRRKIRQDLSNGRINQDSPEMLEHREAYLRNLEYADYVTNEMIAYLKEYDLYDDTLLIIGADHGEAFGEHNSLGHSSTVYDSMIHVPLVVHYPGVEPRIVDQHVGLIDLYPTIAELLSLEVQNPHIQGRSLAPLFTGDDQEPVDYYYSRAVDYTTGLKIDKVEHVLIRTRFTLRGERYKYIFNDWDEELYDIIDDPLELNNIAGMMPATVTALRQRGFALISYSQSIKIGSEEADIGEDEEELKNLGYLQ